MDMREFLEAVACGNSGFNPASDSVEDLSAFQQLAQLALEAEDRGYVSSVVAHRESHSGHRFYSVIVVRSITPEGLEAIRGL